MSNMTRPLATSSQRAEALRILADWRAGSSTRKVQRRALSATDLTPVCVIADGSARVSILDALLTPQAASEALEMVFTQ